MSDMLARARQALRSLSRAPVLTTVAVLTLALSIGLTTAIFSVVDAVVLRPLPIANPERVIAFCEQESADADWCGASVPDIYELAERSRAVEVAGAARSWPFVLRTTEGAASVSGGLATPGAFEALGIRAAAGRLIEPDDLGENFRRVVVVSDAFWRSRLGARRDAIGERIMIDDEPHTVVGVLPASASVPNLEFVELWRPIHFDPRDDSRRDWRGFQAFARLREGATLEQARSEVSAIASDIRAAHFPTKPTWRVVVRPWQDVIVGPVRALMYLLLGAVGLVLLIGCANVSNLLLARATTRQHDMAVRTALGASRAQLVRALLLESFLLALFGAAAGLVLASWATRAFVALAPAGIPRIDEVGMDPRVLGFTVLVSVVTTMLVGTAPALRATGGSLQETLLEGGRGSSGRRTAFGSALIVVEMALALVLVTGAGLLLRSFATALRWSPGFEQEHLLTVWTFASPAKFDTREELVSYYVRAREELASIPSVVSVGEGSAGPLFGGDGEGSFTLDGQTAGSGAPRQAALWYDIDPHYFRTLGVPIVRGRDIDATDVVGAPLAAVVNETFARRYLGDRDPLGHVVHMNEHDTSFTIVGIVRDVPPVRADESVPPQIFWSNRQIPRPATYFLVRTAGDPASVGTLVRDRLQAMDPDLQVGTVRTMREWLARTLVRPRFATVLVATFGVLALALAAIGTYGLLAYDVTRQRREIGIRIALGAAPRTIVAAVLGRGMRLAVLAMMLGVAGSIGLTRLLRGELSGVSPTDPATFAASALVLLAIAAIACVLPAWRASDVDPLETLRTE